MGTSRAAAVGLGAVVRPYCSKGYEVNEIA